MAKRQGHGRKNQKPTDAWSMDGCRAFWRYKTNKEKNESRRIIVKASTKKKNKWPMSIWSWSVSSKMYSNMPGGEGEDPTLLGKWSNFFWMLGNTWLELKKRSNLKNKLLVIFFKSFRSPRNQPPFKGKHIWLQKKGAKPAHLFLFTHVPCPSKQWNPGSDTAIGLFFSPHPVKRNSLVSTFGVMYLGRWRFQLSRNHHGTCGTIMGLVGPSWDFWDHTTFAGKWDPTVFFCSTVSKCSSHQIRLMFLNVRPGKRSARSPFFAEVLNLFRQKFYQKYHPSEKPNTWNRKP